MLCVLSPAKKLDYERTVPRYPFSQPLFVREANELIATLRQKSITEIAALMSLSTSLAQLNVQRYATWQTVFEEPQARAALFAFNGDVYEGLDAYSLSEQQVVWAQEHLAILSGLYGVLRPLDLMHPYRLEMGTKLAVADTKNLYGFWGNIITEHLNKALDSHTNRVLVNLASDEYFKSVNLKVLDAQLIQCVFEDWKAGKFKVISFHAKRARGLMARFIIENQTSKPEDLQYFCSEEYTYDASVSTSSRLVFRRRLADD